MSAQQVQAMALDEEARALEMMAARLRIHADLLRRDDLLPAVAE